MASPRMASQYSADAQVKSFERPMFPECFKCILRTCRGETAARLLERRDADLIESDQHDEREYGGLFKLLRKSVTLL